MELSAHIAEAAFALAAVGFVGLYSRTEDLTFLFAAALCAVSALLAFLLSWPWFLAIGGIAAALLLMLTVGGWRKDS